MVRAGTCCKGVFYLYFDQTLEKQLFPAQMNFILVVDSSIVRGQWNCLPSFSLQSFSNPSNTLHQGH